jgi:hypothetical protein
MPSRRKLNAPKKNPNAIGERLHSRPADSVQIQWGKRRGDYVDRRGCKPSDGAPIPGMRRHGVASLLEDHHRDMHAAQPCVSGPA